MFDENKINERLNDLLGKKNGFFGHVKTWGQRPEPYEFIGYELSEDFLPTWKTMHQDQQMNLVKIMTYFEIHARPLKIFLERIQAQKDSLDTFFLQLSWSHFMTVVMFGMLEAATKITAPAKINKKHGSLEDKGPSIKFFLETYLSQDTKDSILMRYKVEDLSNFKIATFGDVVDHLWFEIRSGFIHDMGIQSKGLEWTTFISGRGTENDPIRIESDVPMQEWLQITWQAILNSYGYKGLLQHPKYIKS